MAKKRNRFYFTKEAENAIVEYNEEKDPEIRSKIYCDRIQKPLNKLVENVINRFKFPYFKETSEDLQADVVSFLVMNMSKYEQEKGKAFSYFSILAKNHLILNNNNEYKQRKIQQRIDTAESEFVYDIIDEDVEREMNDDIPEFVELMVDYWENNLSCVFTKRQEIMIADAIVTLFKRSKSIENFNKKYLFLLIREMTGLRTQYITSVVNKMREHIKILQKQYNKLGHFDTKKSLE